MPPSKNHDHTKTALEKLFENRNEPAARNEIVNRHVPYVYRIVGMMRKTMPKNVSTEDMTQNGIVGLMQAIQTYDPAKGVPFPYHAGRRIKGRIADMQRNETKSRTMNPPGRILSFDGLPLEEKEAAELEPETPPAIDATDGFFALIQKLPAGRDRGVLIRKFIHKQSHKEIGEQLGISAASVSVLYAGAIKELRERMKEEEGIGTISSEGVFR